MAPWHSPVSSGTQTRLKPSGYDQIHEEILCLWTTSFQVHQLWFLGSPCISCCCPLLSASKLGTFGIACAHVRGGVN